MTPAELDALVARLRELATNATEGPWFVGYDEAHDTIPHRDSGLSLVDTGRQSDWPIARLCESGNANFIAACDPQTILHLFAALAALRADAERWTLFRDKWCSDDGVFQACIIDADTPAEVDAAIDAARAGKP